MAKETLSLQPRIKRIIRSTLKIALRIIIGLIIFMLLLVVLVQTPFVQNIIKEKVIVKLAQKLHTRIEVGNVKLTLLGSVEIDHIFVADDRKDTLLNLDKLTVRVNPIPLFHKRVIFSSISLSGLHFTYDIRDTSGKSNIDFITKAFADSTQPRKKEPSPWKIEARSVRLKGIKLQLANHADSSLVKLTAGDFDIYLSESDLSQMKFVVTSIVLDNSEISSVTYRKKDRVTFPANEKSKANNGPPIMTVIKELSLTNVNFNQYDSVSHTGGKYHVGNASVTPETIDIPNKIISLQHLSFKHVSISMTTKSGPAKNTDTIPSPASGPGWSLSLQKGDIGIDSIHVVNIAPDQGDSISYLSNISVSDISLDFSAAYRSPQSWSAHIGNFRMKDNRTGQLTTLILNAALNNNRLDIRQLNFKTGTSQVEMNGIVSIQHLQKQLFPDFQIKVPTIRIIKKDFMAYLPSKAIFKRYHLPDTFLFSGDFSSHDQQLKGQGKLYSEMGTITFDGHFFKSSPLSESSYYLKTTIREVQLGRMLNDSILGQLTAGLTVNGKGLNPDSLNASLTFHIDSVSLAHKSYSNVNLNGSLTNGIIALTSAIADHGADLRLSVNGQIKNKRPDIKVIADIRRLDFKELGLMHDSLVLKGYINASYRNLSRSKLDAYTDSCNVTFFMKGKKIETHNQLNYSVHNDTVKAYIGSDFGSLTYLSNIPAGRTTPLLRQYFGRYYALGIDTPRLKDDQFLNFSLDIRDLSTLGTLLPNDLTIPEGGRVTGELAKQKFKANIDFNQITYNKLGLDSIHVAANGSDSSLNIQLRASAFKNSIQTIRNVEFTNITNMGSMDIRLKFDNGKEEPWFNLGMTVLKKGNVINATLKPPMLLNHDKWDVDPSNELVINDKNITFRNFSMSNDSARISVTNVKPDGIAVTLQHLGLSFISELIKGDPKLLTGECNGNMAVLHLSGTEKTFDSKVKFNDMKAGNQLIGNLDAAISNTVNPEIINLNVSLENNNMSLSAKGHYGLKDNPSQITVATNDLNLASFGPLMDTYLTSPSGQINALLNISGNMSKPQINGNVNFKTVSFMANALQAKFAIDGQRIVFNGDRVTLPAFQIKDETGNPLTIDGNATYSDFKNLVYKFNITSSRFLAYHVFTNKQPSKENKVYLTNKIEVEGTNASPIVNAEITVDEGSKIYYQMAHRSSDYSEDGVVTFIGSDQDTTQEEKISLSKNLWLKANITIAEGTPIAIITDPTKGDMLTVTSGGTFSISQQPFQAPRMIGKIDISGGSYSLTLAGFKKTFTIMPNSSINWTGDIASPEFDLKAYYEIRSSPEPLYAESQATSSQHLGAIPFRVQMNIKGSLATPTLSFEITLPEEYQNSDVATLLQQVNSDPSRVDREAMSLLLFGTFDISSIFTNVSLNTVNSLSNSGGANALLSRAMNQFAAHEVKFVDLNFNLQSYDEYGVANSQDVRTELKVEAARKLVNDRLNAKGGATFVLQADEIEQNKPWYEKITPELNVGYLLNKPRTISIRVFRQNEYRGLLEGKVVNTGTGILFQKDFDTARELFNKPKNETGNVLNEKETNDSNFKLNR